MQEKKTEEEANTWFKERVQGEKGPLRKVSLGVMSKELERNGNKLTLVLGASVTHEEPGKNSFGVTNATWDFPWFAIVLNVLCMAADGMGHFCAWELSFEESGKIGARALAESKQQPLDPNDRKLLELLGFRLVGSPLPLINLKKLGADPRDWPQKERVLNTVRTTTHTPKPKAKSASKVIQQANGLYMASIPGGDKKFLVPSKKRVPTKQEVENEVIARLTKDDRHLSETFYAREQEVYGFLEKIRCSARRVRLSGVIDVDKERAGVNNFITKASQEFRENKKEIYPKLLEAIARAEAEAAAKAGEPAAKKVKIEETSPSNNAAAQTSANAEGSASPSNPNQTEEKLTSTTTA